MHLIQGTLDSSATLMTTAAGVLAVAAACYGARKELSAKKIPSLVAMSGFVFFAQMVNYSTGLGFSGHLVGAALLAILFGPFSAMLSMACILVAQVTLLGDGSMSTLGANFMNMGVVAPWAAYGVYRLLQGRRAPQFDAGQIMAVAVASAVSILGVSLSLSLMIGGSLASMLSTYLVIGVVELALSVSVFSLCVRHTNVSSNATLRLTLKPIVAICLLAFCLAPLSSNQPDGLEHVLAAVADTDQ